MKKFFVKFIAAAGAAKENVSCKSYATRCRNDEREGVLFPNMTESLH
jgi:hypothetical protein